MNFTNSLTPTFPAPRSVVDLPRSPILGGLEWLGPEIPYPEAEKKGDTFPITWGADGEQYTSAGDPLWGQSISGLDVEKFTGEAPNYRIEKLHEMPDYLGWGGDGPKACGMISVAGVLYLAFQNATAEATSPPVTAGRDSVLRYGHGYDAHIIRSTDFGRTWEPALKDIGKPMFPGRAFAALSFVQFGRDNAGARDPYVYAISGEGWDNGCHCRLSRVPGDQIMDRAAWEFVSGFDGHSPRWSSALDAAIPVLRHPGYLGMMEMVYLAPLRRYLLLGWHHKVKHDPDCGSELIVYDSPEPWGPFTLVHHEDPWETERMNPYNPRLPLKWFDPVKLQGWLLFSGSWRPDVNRELTYRAHVRPFRLLRK